MPTPQELESLLSQPSETLSVEHKSWLDLSIRPQQALLAKAAIALANHGGGIVVIGTRGDDAEGGLQSHPRPDNIARYRQDDINAVINRFCDPQLHCELHFAQHPVTQFEQAFVVVPSGIRVPVMSKRDCNGIISSQRCYIRKPGPRSEEPFTSVEWRGLLDRCVRSGREDMLDAIRLIVQGRAGETPDPTELDSLLQFSDAALDRWNELIAALPPDDPARFPAGRYEMSFQIADFPPNLSLAQLRQKMDEAGATRLTGWGPFISLNREPLAPYIFDGMIEAWLGAADEHRFQRTPSHCDFWRARRDGKFILIRGFDEDGLERVRPGQFIDITLPVWRVGEGLLYVSRLARSLGLEPMITVRVKYIGIGQRSLTSIDGRRMLFEGWRSLDNEVILETQASIVEIEENLAEVLYPMLAPLYERFNFFEPPMQLFTEELATLRGNRF